MKSLYDEYNIVFSARDWCYYNEFKNSYKSLEDIFDNPKEFIKNYFKAGKKSSVIKDSLLNDLSNSRLAHVVSTYFLGFALKSKLATLCKSIENKCAEFDEIIPNNNTDPDNTFIFTWFLTCLGHDYGYLLEQEIDKKIDDVENFSDIVNPSMIANYLPPKRHSLCPKTLKDICVNYYKASIDRGDVFRKKSCMDHGIVGGVLLYQLLKQNYQQAKKNAEISYDRKVFDSFNYDDRFWSDTINKTYKAASAWAIICHNIWTINPDNPNKKKAKKIYRDFGLKELITKSPLINGKKHPFLFLLSLADTLEPIKSPKAKDGIMTLLKKTQIDIQEAEILVKNHPNQKLDLRFLGFNKVIINSDIQNFFKN